MVERHIREMALRNVISADMFLFVLLMLSEFLKLAALAFIIAAQLSWYHVSDWLDNYSYSVSLKWLPFAVSAIVATVITMITVLYHALKVSVVNPVEILKYE